MSQPSSYTPLTSDSSDKPTKVQPSATNVMTLHTSNVRPTVLPSLLERQTAAASNTNTKFPLGMVINVPSMQCLPSEIKVGEDGKPITQISHHQQPFHLRQTWPGIVRRAIPIDMSFSTRHPCSQTRKPYLQELMKSEQQHEDIIDNNFLDSSTIHTIETCSIIGRGEANNECSSAEFSWMDTTKGRLNPSIPSHDGNCHSQTTIQEVEEKDDDNDTFDKIGSLELLRGDIEGHLEASKEDDESLSSPRCWIGTTVVVDVASSFDETSVITDRYYTLDPTMTPYDVSDDGSFFHWFGDGKPTSHPATMPKRHATVLYDKSRRPHKE